MTPPISYLLLFIVSYLLGSISSAYVVGRWVGKTDIRDEGDGRISAAAIHRRLGVAPFLLVVAMDIGKSSIAILIAEYVFFVPLEITMLTGAIAVIAHQWSPFIRFQGGQGATAIGGVLFTMIFFPTALGAACGALLVLLIKKSTISFAFAITMISILMAIFPSLTTLPVTPLLIAYPVILLLMLAVKALQIKYLPRNAYKVVK